MGKAPAASVATKEAPKKEEVKKEKKKPEPEPEEDEDMPLGLF